MRLENVPKDNIGGDCITEIRQAIIDKGIIASGATNRSLSFSDTGQELTIYAEGKHAPIKTLQTGREAGAVPRGFVGIIRQWIIDKGIKVRLVPYKTNRPHKYSVEERSLLMASGAIAHKIKEEGTERHTNNRDDIYTPALNRAVQRFEGRWAKYMKTTITKTLIK